MATFVKFHDFVHAVLRKEHDLEDDTFKIALTNSEPDVAVTGDTVIGDITQITVANGYASGGTLVESSVVGKLKVVNSGGTVTVKASEVTFTASGGAMAEFQYAVLYNSTSGGLVGYWDYGVKVNLASTETFKVRFNNTTPDGTIFTLS